MPIFEILSPPHPLLTPPCCVPSPQFIVSLICRSLNHQRFLICIRRECLSYEEYKLMVNKQSPEAHAMVQTVEALYSVVANWPQLIKLINTPQINEAYELKPINTYYDILKAMLRKKAIIGPTEGEDSTVSASMQNSLSNATDRISWLKVLDDTLAMCMPLPCPEFIHNFSVFMSKKAPIISKVGLFGYKHMR